MVPQFFLALLMRYKPRSRFREFICAAIVILGRIILGRLSVETFLEPLLLVKFNEWL